MSKNQIQGLSWMMFLAKILGIYSASSLDHMSLLPRDCPAVLNFSSGQCRAERVLCGAGRGTGQPVSHPWFSPSIRNFGTLFTLIGWQWHLPVRKQIYETPPRYFKIRKTYITMEGRSMKCFLWVGEHQLLASTVGNLIQPASISFQAWCKIYIFSGVDDRFYLS